jgi:uncharacterized protein (TIGR02246 family)
MRIRQLSNIVVCVVAAPLWGASESNADADAIRALEVRQEVAWNAHNAHAYAQLFTSDADIVNVLGWWWKSRAELDQKLDKGFSFVFARSHLHIDDVAIRFLTAEVAIAHVQWSMSGAASPDGSGSNVPQKGIQTQTLYKSAGGWLIAAFQNTNALPERAFPSGPH